MAFVLLDVARLQLVFASARLTSVSCAKFFLKDLGNHTYSLHIYSTKDNTKVCGMPNFTIYVNSVIIHPNLRCWTKI